MSKAILTGSEVISLLPEGEESVNTRLRLVLSSCGESFEYTTSGVPERLSDMIVVRLSWSSAASQKRGFCMGPFVPAWITAEVPVIKSVQKGSPLEGDRVIILVGS